MIYLWISLCFGTVFAVQQKDIVLYYFNQSSPDVHLYKFNLEEEEKFSTLIDLSKPSVFMVHGWVFDPHSDDDNAVGKAVLTTHDVNYFAVDYPYKFLYNQAVDIVTTVGKYLGGFLNNLWTDHRYSLSKIRLIGHSLGAHICGITGKTTKGALASITGLDPAGPLFDYSYIDNRLDKHDAKYVEIIHTSSKSYGVSFNCGHADFYPNGGEIQPGCDLLTPCSHLRAIEFYVTSLLNSNDLIATKCPSYDLFKEGSCAQNSKAYMGGYIPDRWAKGTYYLKTK